MIFVDSSALVKRYIEEPGSDTLDILFDETDAVMASRLAYAETLCALMRRRPTLDLTDKEFAQVIAAFRHDWGHFIVLEMNDEALQRIDRVIDSYALKGADSIHLSTAIWIKQCGNAGLIFVASDKELLAAARKERFNTIDPQEDSLPRHPALR